MQLLSVGRYAVSFAGIGGVLSFSVIFLLFFLSCALGYILKSRRKRGTWGNDTR